MKLQATLLLALLAQALAVNNNPLAPGNREVTCDECQVDVDAVNESCSNVDVSWLTCVDLFIEAGVDCVQCFCNVVGGIIGGEEAQAVLCDPLNDIPIHEVKY